MAEDELTYAEYAANQKVEHQSMETSDKDIAYFEIDVELSEYAIEALKAEGLRRGLDDISKTIEAVACDLEVGRGRGNPAVRRYR